MDNVVIPHPCQKKSFVAKTPLVIIPAHNEEHTIEEVIEVIRDSYDGDICVIDDGSQDGTRQILERLDQEKLHLVTHEKNQGYGAALISGFEYAIENNFDAVVTIDSDGQHEPRLISQFLKKLRDADIVSGTRYERENIPGDAAPADRKKINMQITEIFNQTLGLNISDSFCGYKSYRTSALKKLRLSETGYGFPLEVWVNAAAQDLCITELSIPRIYLDLNRSFGGGLDDPTTRLHYYCQVMESAFTKHFGISLKELTRKKGLCGN